MSKSSFLEKKHINQTHFTFSFRMSCWASWERTVLPAGFPMPNHVANRATMATMATISEDAAGSLQTLWLVLECSTVFHHVLCHSMCRLPNLFLLILDLWTPHFHSWTTGITGPTPSRPRHQEIRKLHGLLHIEQSKTTDFQIPQVNWFISFNSFISKEISLSIWSMYFRISDSRFACEAWIRSARQAAEQRQSTVEAPLKRRHKNWFISFVP